MAITINGTSNTITGLAAGGLPDNTIDNGSMADDAIGVAELSATGTASSSTYLRGDNSWAAVPAGGITEYDRWRLTTSFTGDATPIASNLSRVTNQNYNVSFPLGTGMTESSGIFTFPSTGWWLVSCGFLVKTSNSNSSATSYNIMYLQSTDDNGSNWATPTEGFANWHSGEYNQYSSGYCTQTFDITDLSNDKVRFSFDTSNATYGELRGSNNDQTWFEFMKLADT